MSFKSLFLHLNEKEDTASAVYTGIMKKQNKAATMTDEQRARAAQRCTWIGFGCNGVLSILKIVAGIVGHSGAMIADGVHSISDFLTDIIVIVFVGVSARGVNKVYRYGHGKFETFSY